MNKTQNKKSQIDLQSYSWLLGGISIGVVAAFFLDPDRGKRRRALVRDKAVHLNKITNRLVERKTHHARNILHGYWMRSYFGKKHAQNEKMLSRENPRFTG